MWWQQALWWELSPSITGVGRGCTALQIEIQIAWGFNVNEAVLEKTAGFDLSMADLCEFAGQMMA